MSIAPLIQALGYLVGDEPLPSAVFLSQPVTNWDPYLDLGLPLVIKGRLDQVECDLEASGLSPGTPRRWIDEEGRVRPEAFPGAAVLVVGLTHANEGWRERLPLFGKKLVLTRAAEKLPALSSRLEGLGAKTVAYPVLEFEPLDPILPDLADLDWVLFTSPNGVRFFWDCMVKQGWDCRALARARIACIGPGTAESLRVMGLKADLIPKEFVAESFLEALSGEQIEGSRILIPRALEAREVLPEGLRAQGAEVQVLPVYRTVRPGAELKLDDDCQAVLFSSSSTVRHFWEASGLRLPAACIGPVTAATARELGFPLLCVAREHTIEGLVQELIHTFGGASEPA